MRFFKHRCFSPLTRVIRFLLVGMSISFCSTSGGQSEVATGLFYPNNNSQRGDGKLDLAVSLIWDGQDLKNVNLDAIQNFRKNYSNIPITHFFNAAYFVRNSDKATKIADKIRATIRPGDTIGLHLNGWKSTVAGAGIIFRRDPSFWGNELDDNTCSSDCGSDIPISIYSKNDLEKLIHFAKVTITNSGLGEPKIFLAGGWMANSQVLAAARKEGFLIDSSAVSPAMFQKRLGPYPLMGWLEDTWGKITPFSQPHKIETASGEIWEVPLNGGILEYHSTSEILSLFKVYSNHLKAGEHKQLVFHIGFFQESAWRQVPVLSRTIQEMFVVAGRDQINLSPMPWPESQITKEPLLSH